MTRSERTYYIVFALYNLSWAFMGAIYPLFLMSRGLDLFQINAILAVYLFCNFAFEVPTGAIADLFGRKVSFLLSCAVRAAAFALYFTMDTFAGFVFAEIIDAIGTTLASGALDAWAIDGMKEEGDNSPADRLFSRGRMLSHAAMIVSGLIGGYVGDVDIAYPWLVGVCGFLVTMTVGAALMRRDYPEAAPVRSGATILARLNPLPAIQAQISGGLTTVSRHPTLRFLCGVTALLSFAQMPVMQMWPAHLKSLSDQGTWLLGWVWAFLNLAALVGSWSLPRLLARFGRPRAALYLSVFRCIGVVVAALSGGFGKATLGLIGQAAGTGASDPLLGAWMNEHAESHQRATVLSIQTMSFMLGGSAGLLVLGLLARYSGVPLAWGVAAVVLLITAAVLWRSRPSIHTAAKQHPKPPVVGEASA